MYIEGNGGADYIEVEPLSQNLLRLEVAHCGVVVVRQIVPVEFLTAAISDVVLRHGGPKRFLRSTGWSTEYVRYLVSQMEQAPVGPGPHKEV